MSWRWAALMPHPPIILPEVGRGRECEAASTLAGMDRLVAELGERAMPDRVLLLSPHQPYGIGTLFINAAHRAKGSFAPFDAPSVAFDLATPQDDAEALAAHVVRHGLRVSSGIAEDLSRDQGSMVPLYFLRRAYDGRLPEVVLANPIGLGASDALALGRALADFDDGKSWGLLASGDLSHRLKPGAPAGYSPEGEIFDRAVVEALEDGSPDGLLAISPKRVDAAGECGYRSVLALLGLCGSRGGKIEVFSYEGPFGVGYCNALWMGDDFNVSQS